MNYVIKNSALWVEFSSIGGELLSIKTADGLEYIWQGDKKYWGSRSPILFPYCCRLFDGRYTHKGQSYDGNIHGFIRKSELSDVTVGDDFIIFRKVSDSETKKLYPFDFIFELKYSLSGNSLISEIKVTNTGCEELYYCQGMHPGFNVPLDGGCFEDWYIEFGGVASPRRILFSESKFCCGYSDFSPSLDGGTKLALNHALFDVDAYPSVSIRSDASDRSVTVDFPDSQAIGFWQPDHTDAPFVCIEPLGGIPSFDGIVDELSKKPFARCVAPGESHTDTVTVTVK